MASVWLSRRGWQEGHTPDVCMICGRRAPRRVDTTFTWTPSWVLLFLLFGPVGVVLMVALGGGQRRKRRSFVPMCEEHRNHWRWRNALGLGALLTFLVVAGVGLGLGIALSRSADVEVEAIEGVICVSYLGILWMLGVGVLQSAAIRAVEFSEDSIHLRNVCREFKEEYEAFLDEDSGRSSPGALDDSARELWLARERLRGQAPEGVREESAVDPTHRDDRYAPE